MAGNNYIILMKKLRSNSLEPDKKSDKQIIQDWDLTGFIQEANHYDKDDYLTCACSHPHCKTLFTIQNSDTREKLEVGTRCIKRFEVFDEELKKISDKRKKQFKKEQLEKHNINE